MCFFILFLFIFSRPVVSTHCSGGSSILHAQDIMIDARQGEIWGMAITGSAHGWIGRNGYSHRTRRTRTHTHTEREK